MGMLPSFCKKTVTVIHPSTKVERGTTIPDWTNVTKHVVHGCSMQPSSTDSTQVRNMRLVPSVNSTETAYTLFMPPNSPVQSGDRMVIDSKTWSVDGEPMEWESASGALSHMVVELKRYRG